MAIVGILAGVTIAAINPIKQFLGAQNVGRAYRAQQIERAVFQYIVDRNDYPGDKNIPEGEENAKPICRYGKTTGGCINIDELIPRYVVCMPFDEAETNANYSGYKIYLSAGRGNVVSTYEDQNVSAGGGCEPFPEPIAWWKLDDADPDSDPAVDAAGNWNGTYSGANKPSASTDIPSSAEFAFRNLGSKKFDGDDHIVIPVEADVSGNDLAISAWIKPDSSAEATIIAKASSDASPVNTRWSLGITSTNKLRMRLGDGSSVMDTEAGSIVSGRWTHVMGAYNGTRACLYINGEQVGGCNSNGNITLPKGNMSVWIGDTPANAGGTNHFDGLIDDVRIYEYPLSEGQSEVIATGGV